MPTDGQQHRIDAATKLLPIYNQWHKACVVDPDAKDTKAFEAKLWQEARKHTDLGIPIKMEAAVGRWIARSLKLEWKAFDGIIT